MVITNHKLLGKKTGSISRNMNEGKHRVFGSSSHENSSGFFKSLTHKETPFIKELEFETAEQKVRK